MSSMGGRTPRRGGARRPAVGRRRRDRRAVGVGVGGARGGAQIVGECVAIVGAARLVPRLGEVADGLAPRVAPAEQGQLVGAPPRAAGQPAYASERGGGERGYWTCGWCASRGVTSRSDLPKEVAKLLGSRFGVYGTDFLDAHGLQQLLLSEHNELFDPAAATAHLADGYMDHPLTDYFIASSHNLVPGRRPVPLAVGLSDVRTAAQGRLPLLGDRLLGWPRRRPR